MESGRLPTVTVVIPTHDRREMLQATLHSVLRQRDVELSVVVVDDGSSDGTEQAVDKLGEDRVTVLRHERSLGQARARNAGIEAAEGEWIALLDDDDLWAPDKLRRQLEAAREFAARFVYCGAVTFTRDDNDILPDRPAPPAAELRALLTRGNPLPGGCSSQLVDAALLKSLGGFDESLEYLSDWDMWLRISRETTAAAVDAPLVAYRIHDGNRVANEGRAHVLEFERFARKHAVDGAADPDGAGFSFWVANGQRRGSRRGAAVMTHLRAAWRYRSLGHVTSAFRAPFGARALGLRDGPAPQRLPAPAWLVELSGEVELWP